jgi:hypothetical protein
MKKNILFLLFAFLALTLRAFAQPTSGWEEKVSIGIPSQTYVIAATSDGYGQHILIRKNTTFNHYLVGNDGVILYSNTISPEPVLNSEFSATITSGNGVLTVVAGDGNAIKLWHSSNGGQTWSSPVVQPISASVVNIDATATSYDDNVYVVWDNAYPSNSNPKVYYYRYHPLVGWQDFQEVTDIGGRGLIPKLAVTANKIVVSFSDPSDNKKGKSRDRLLQSAWDNFYRVTPDIQDIDWVAYTNVAAPE